MTDPTLIEPVKLKSGPHEAKFELAGSAVLRAHALLAKRLQPDAEYPDAHVYSLYYDTPNLRYLGDKESSDYHKRKVRIRWYADPVTHVTLPPAFLEAKFKLGATRSKARLMLPDAAPEIASMELGDVRLRQLIGRLAEKGVPLAPGIAPLILIRYRRRRFVLPRVSARVCIDSDIRAIAAHPTLGAVIQTPLPHAVVEVKGSERTLPVELLPMSSLGVRLSSFSKYLRCVDAVRARS